jgi:hypothetical protein
MFSGGGASDPECGRLVGSLAASIDGVLSAAQGKVHGCLIWNESNGSRVQCTCLSLRSGDKIKNQLPAYERSAVNNMKSNSQKWLQFLRRDGLSGKPWLMVRRLSWPDSL